MELLASKRLLITVLLTLSALVVSPWLVKRPRDLQALVLKLFTGGYAWVQASLTVLISVLCLIYPGYLAALEGSMLIHVQRLYEGLSVYPIPTASFVPLAYNPGLYVSAIPFAWLFGPELTAFRIAPILAWLGLGALAYVYVSRKTGSRPMGLLSLGLVFSSHKWLDHQMMTASADSLFLLLVLGAAILAGSRQTRNLLLVALMLALAFWVKQTAVVLAGGVLLFLTWREGWKASVPIWSTFVLIGPGAYWTIGPALFGPALHDFTYSVPRGWVTYDISAVTRFIGYQLSYVPALVGLSVWVLISALRRRAELDAVVAVFPFAMAAGLLGTFDLGSVNNVFGPPILFAILLGCVGLYQLGARGDSRRLVVAITLGAMSTGLLSSDPRDSLPPAGAADARYDLERTVLELEGPIHWPMDGLPLVAPDRAPLKSDRIAIHDLSRGTPTERTREWGEDIIAELRDSPDIEWIIARWRMEEDAVYGQIADQFVLVEDYEERFAPLRGLLQRFGAPYPRYLYRRIERVNALPFHPLPSATEDARSD